LQTPVYGTNFDATVSSDMSYLRSTNFDENMLVKKMVVCGANMTFAGIQLVLEHPSTRKKLYMN